MKKSILNLGKALNKTEQRTINGGKAQCDQYNHCNGSGFCCDGGECRIIGSPGVICDAEIPRPNFEY